MEMQVRSSIQDLVLAFRAAVTDGFKQGTYSEYDYDDPHVNAHHDVRIAKDYLENVILGAGFYSATRLHPTDEDKVIKVWVNGIDGAWNYINKCWQLQGTGEAKEWMPVVYELGMCMGKPYAVMEKLVPYTKASTVSTFHTPKWEILFEDFFGFVPDDIHLGNVMYRRVLSSDGTLQEVGVITDPVTEWE